MLLSVTYVPLNLSPMSLPRTQAGGRRDEKVGGRRDEKVDELRDEDVDELWDEDVEGRRGSNHKSREFNVPLKSCSFSKHTKVRTTCSSY